MWGKPQLNPDSLPLNVYIGCLNFDFHEEVGIETIVQSQKPQTEALYFDGGYDGLGSEQLPYGYSRTAHTGMLFLSYHPQLNTTWHLATHRNMAADTTTKDQ